MVDKIRWKRPATRRRHESWDQAAYDAIEAIERQLWAPPRVQQAIQVQDRLGGITDAMRGVLTGPGITQRKVDPKEFKREEMGTPRIRIPRGGIITAS